MARPPRPPPPKRAPQRARRRIEAPQAPRHGLARVISKLGIASRAQAARWIAEGRVSVDGRVARDAERPTDAASERIAVDGVDVHAQRRVYLMLNKPRGVITTAADEQGRDTVYALLADAGLPWLAPVGRLDKASEGLLLLTNDSAWAARITAPDAHLDKTYHVRRDGFRRGRDRRGGLQPRRRLGRRDRARSRVVPRQWDPGREATGPTSTPAGPTVDVRELPGCAVA